MLPRMLSWRQTRKQLWWGPSWSGVDPDCTDKIVPLIFTVLHSGEHTPMVKDPEDTPALWDGVAVQNTGFSSPITNFISAPHWGTKFLDIYYSIYFSWLINQVSEHLKVNSSLSPCNSVSISFNQRYWFIFSSLLLQRLLNILWGACLSSLERRERMMTMPRGEE